MCTSDIIGVHPLRPLQLSDVTTVGRATEVAIDFESTKLTHFFRENFFHGLIGQHAVYAIFDPPRYFASEHLKLTYHNSLETTEYVVDEVARIVDLHPKRLPIVAALLGQCSSPTWPSRAALKNSCFWFTLEEYWVGRNDQHETFSADRSVS